MPEEWVNNNEIKDRISYCSKNQLTVFGEYIDVYTMTRAVEDEAIVKIYYLESY